MPTTDMPRGRGSKVRSKAQTAFATAVAGSGFFERNTYAHDSEISRDFADDDVLGSAGLANGVDARPAAPGLEDGALSITWPVDLMQFGFVLQEMLGGPTTTGSGPYVHTFFSGAATIPVTTFERELKSGQLRKVTGAVLRQLVLPFGPGEGYQEARAEYVARQVSAPYDTSIATTPTVLALASRVPKSVGALKLDGVTLGRLLSGTATLTNTIESDRYNGEALLSDAWRSGFGVEIAAEARYFDETLANLGNVGADGYLPDSHLVQLEYILSASLKLVLIFYAVRVMPVSVPVGDGGPMTVSLRMRAEVATSTVLLEAQLTNSRATY